jgi:hypothetical protein
MLIFEHKPLSHRYLNLDCPHSIGGRVPGGQITRTVYFGHHSGVAHGMGGGVVSARQPRPRRSVVVRSARGRRGCMAAGGRLSEDGGRGPPG